MTTISNVGVLPWLDIRETITVGDITFHRADEIGALLRERSTVLADRLSIYRDPFDNHVTHGTVALHQSQLTDGGPVPYLRLRRAVDILMIAAMFANDGDMRQQNATTFALYIQNLGGESGFMAHHIRRRNRGTHMGTSTEVIITKPLYAEHFTSWNRTIRDALVVASNLPEDVTWRLFDSIEWFRRGSTDADNIEPVVDLVLILTAVEFLLAHPGTKGPGLDYVRMRTLLSPFETAPCCSVVKTRAERSHIEAVLYAVNLVRNTSVHPRSLDETHDFGFSRSGDPALAWLADRAYMALIVARLVEMNALAMSDEVGAFVSGVEHWIQDPKDAIGLVISKAKLDSRLRRWFLEKHHEEVELPEKAHTVDEARLDWERDFFLTLGTVREPWRIDLDWLKDGKGVIRIWERLPKERLREYMIFDPTADPAVRMAYAALVYPEDDSVPQPMRTFSDDDLRAMRDLGLWIHGDVQPG
jgi:hypothetical protein